MLCISHPTLCVPQSSLCAYLQTRLSEGSLIQFLEGEPWHLLLPQGMQQRGLQLPPPESTPPSAWRHTSATPGTCPASSPRAPASHNKVPTAAARGTGPASCARAPAGLGFSERGGCHTPAGQRGAPATNDGAAKDHCSLEAAAAASAGVLRPGALSPKKLSPAATSETNVAFIAPSTVSSIEGLYPSAPSPRMASPAAEFADVTLCTAGAFAELNDMFGGCLPHEAARKLPHSWPAAEERRAVGVVAGNEVPAPETRRAAVVESPAADEIPPRGVPRVLSESPWSGEVVIIMPGSLLMLLERLVASSQL